MPNETAYILWQKPKFYNIGDIHKFHLLCTVYRYITSLSKEKSISVKKNTFMQR